MIQLSPVDYGVIVEWKAKPRPQSERVLQKLAGHRIPRARAMTITCPDPFRVFDIYDTHRGVAGLDPALPALFGGPLLVPEDSPLVQERHEDLVLMNQVTLGVEHLDVRVLALYFHWPCKAAALVGLTLVEAVQLLVKARRRMEMAFPAVDVACYFHVDYRPHDSKMRSYFFNQKNWEVWYAAQR